MKFKKFLAGSLSVLLLVSTPGAFAAYTESSFNEETRNYIYKNSYDKNMEKENLGYDMELVSDPTNTENKVLHVYDSDGKGDAAGGQSAFATGLVQKEGKALTYEENGINGSKKTYIASDIYLPSALLAELGTDNTLYAGINPANGLWDVNNQVGIAITKTPNNNTFTLTGKTGKTIEVQPDQWFNLKIEVQVGKGNVDFYINNEYFDNGTITSWWISSGYWTVKHECCGILFRSKMLMNAGFYLDNSVIYELKDQDYVVSISDGQTGVEPENKFTLTFDIPVSASDYMGKITAVSGENTYTAAVTQESEKVLAFTFDSLSGQTQYSLNIESVTKGEASFPQKVLSFTTGKGRRNDDTKILYSYTDGETPKLYLYNDNSKKAATFQEINDPTGHSSKVVEYTANGEGGEYSWIGNYATVAGFSNNTTWGKKKYADAGMTDTKTVFLTADIYLPQETLNGLNESSKLLICFGANALASVDQGAGMLYVGKSADGTKYTLSDAKKANIIELPADEWFTYKVEVTPNSGKSDVYINGKYFMTDNSAGNTYSYIKADSEDCGMRIVSHKGTVVKRMLLDNVKYWQMEKEIGIDEIRTDAAEGKIYIDMSTNAVENEISKLCLKHNGTDVSNLITNRAVDKCGYTIILDVDFSKLALLSEYTIEVPFGYKDVNGQSAISSVSRAFTTPKSTSVYVESSNVTAAPSQQGMKASVTLNNVAAERDVWVIAAVFGEYNQMLAVDEKNIKVAGQTEVSFSSADDCSGAKEMRIFVWDSQETMRAVQKNEILWRASGE